MYIYIVKNGTLQVHCRYCTHDCTFNGGQDVSKHNLHIGERKSGLRKNPN